MGAFHSIRTGQIPAFERYMAQLESFYQSCVRLARLHSPSQASAPLSPLHR